MATFVYFIVSLTKILQIVLDSGLFPLHSAKLGAARMYVAIWVTLQDQKSFPSDVIQFLCLDFLGWPSLLTSVILSSDLCKLILLS